jgi:hypothetical protein
MAGVGAGILAWLIGACAVVVFVMGALVIALDRWRAARLPDGTANATELSD